MASQGLEKRYLTTTQAARLLSVSPDTMLKWVRAGRVKSHRTLGGHYRIPLTELGVLEPGRGMANETLSPAQPVMHQYCWEFLAAGGEIKTECRECITLSLGRVVAMS